MRKETGFEVTDRIDIRYTADDDLSAAIESGKSLIMNGTLALTLERAQTDDSFTAREWDINGKKAVLAVRKNG